MSDVRKVPAAEGGRVETGAVQFGEDWRGLFIRGDEAIALALDIDIIAAQLAENPVMTESGAVDVGFHLALGRLKFWRETIRDNVVVGGD